MAGAYGSGLYGDGLYGSGITSSAVLSSVAPAILATTAGAVTVTFTGTNTTWLTVAPTITASAGSLGSTTSVTDISATATFTPPATPQNVTFTDSTDSSSTVLLSVVFIPFTIPAQVPGMPPAMVIEISFASNPGDPPVWTDVTRWVQGTVTIARGRQRELDRIQAGVMTLELDNRDRRFDPTYQQGPYWPNVLPMRRIRARATYNASNYPQYSGYIESWGQSWKGWQDAAVPINAADAFKPLNLAALNTSFPAETSDQRVNEVLSAVGWTVGGAAWKLNDAALSLLGTTTILGPTGDHIVTPGSSTIQASVLANTTALQHLQDVTDTEMGLLFADREGAINFYGRGYAVDTTSTGTFGEGAGEMPYVSLELEFSDNLIWNDLEITRQGGMQQSAADLTSQAQYYRRTLSKTSTLHNTDGDALSLAQALVQKYAQPSLQVVAMTLDGEANPSTIYPQMLRRGLGDRVTVRRRPPGGGQPIDQVSLIQGIAMSYEVAGGIWSVTWRLAQAVTTSYWKLNDPALSILGQTTKLFF